MGCWNATCGVSQLPILSGEKIRVFILEPHHGTNKFIREPNSFVYSTDMFTAYGIPFIAEYNDYGSVENIVESYNAEIIYNKLVESAVLPIDKPFAVGDEVTYIKERKDHGKSYFEVVDIEDDMVSVKKSHRADEEIIIIPTAELRHDNRENYYDDFGDLEQTIKLIERNVFEVNNNTWVQFGMKPTAIPGLFYVRENIWQAMIADIEKEDNQYSFGYKTRKTMLKQIDEFLTELKEHINEFDSGNEETKIRSTIRLFGFEHIGGKGNRIGNMYRSTSDGFSATLYRDHIIDAVRKSDMDFAKKILSDILDTYNFLNAMSSLRKPLIPQCGCGSQEVGEIYHKALNNIISSEIDVIKGYWDEEE